MKKLFPTIVVLFIGCSLFSGEVGAKTAYESDYPSMEELYNNCKQAVNIANTDTKAFLRTYCAARMTGLFEGQYVISARTFSPSTTEQNISTEEEKFEAACRAYVNKKNRQTFCFEKDIPPKSLVELAMARDFVKYVDSLRESHTNVPFGKILASSSNLTMAGFYNNTYSCQSR